MIVRGVKDETDLRFDRSACKDARLPSDARTVLTKRLQQFRQRNFLDWPVDNDPQGASLVVTHHQDNRVLKTRVTHLG